MSTTPLQDPGNWTGRDRPFASADQRAALVGGQPFLILDAVSGFGGVPQPGQKAEVAFLVHLLNDHQRLEGESFVWTRNESPSRLILVELVQEAMGHGNGVGPCQVRLIESEDPARKPFQFIGPYHPEEPAQVVDPMAIGALARVRVPAGGTAEVDLDEIPF